ncbi:MAG: hypothetical protein V1725_02405 [archaeon]
MNEIHLLSKTPGKYDPDLARKVNSELSPVVPTASVASSVISPTSRVSAGDEYLPLENIICVDANGKEFERYAVLYVAKDIVRDSTLQVSHTPYEWAEYFERKGLFLPSFALSCNILVRLFEKAVRQKSDKSYEVVDADIDKVLRQYEDKGNGYGWHAQNTLVDWGKSTIKHYPLDGDFTSNGGTANINRGITTIPFRFDRQGFNNLSFEQALKNKNFESYLRNLTGLQKPEKLIRIGEYFGKPARVWVSGDNKTRAAWVGCSSDLLYIIAGNILSSNGAARGVKLP